MLLSCVRSLCCYCVIADGTTMWVSHCGTGTAAAQTGSSRYALPSLVARNLIYRGVANSWAIIREAALRCRPVGSPAKLSLTRSGLWSES